MAHPVKANAIYTRTRSIIYVLEKKATALFQAGGGFLDMLCFVDRRRRKRNQSNGIYSEVKCRAKDCLKKGEKGGRQARPQGTFGNEAEPSRHK